MAKNLQAKISDSDTLVVFDANEDSTRRFIDEIPNTKKTSVAKDLRHVAEQSVRLQSQDQNIRLCNDEQVPSMNQTVGEQPPRRSFQ